MSKWNADVMGRVVRRQVIDLHPKMRNVEMPNMNRNQTTRRIAAKDDAPTSTTEIAALVTQVKSLIATLKPGSVGADNPNALVAPSARAASKAAADAGFRAGVASQDIRNVAEDPMLQQMGASGPERRKKVWNAQFGMFVYAD